MISNVGVANHLSTDYEGQRSAHVWCWACTGAIAWAGAQLDASGRDGPELSKWPGPRPRSGNLPPQ